MPASDPRSQDEEQRRRPMRILMLNYEFPPIGGGGGQATRALGRTFVEAGHEVRLITSRFGDLPSEDRVDGIHVSRVRVLRKRPDVCKFHEMLTYVVSATYTAHQLLQKWKPDVIQVFFGIPSGPVGTFIHWRYQIPYVVFLGGRDVPRRNPDPPIFRLLYGLLGPAIKSVWGHAAAVIACSHGLRELAWQTDPRAAIDVIPDGADLKRFHPVEREAHPPQVQLLTVTRLIPRKGISTLIEAVSRMETRTPFSLDIVGDGPEREALERRVAACRMAHQVRFIGAVPYEELIDYYHRADVFVLSSLAEGMPLVVLEAMACGLPIVATKVQGIEEVVIPGKNGYLCSPGDAGALARHLTKVVDAGSERLKMGRLSLEYVRPYDWASIAHRYLALYRDIQTRSLLRNKRRRLPSL